MALDLDTDVFYEDGKEKVFLDEYHVLDDFLLFRSEDWVGRTVIVTSIFTGHREKVVVEHDRRAPIPWRSVEAKLSQAQPSISANKGPVIRNLTMLAKDGVISMERVRDDTNFLRVRIPHGVIKEGDKVIYEGDYKYARHLVADNSGKDLVTLYSTDKPTVEDHLDEAHGD